MLRPVLAVCVSLVLVVHAGALELPAVICDHMVLQRDMPVPIWGQADPGAAVSVSIGSKTLTTKADEAGDWRVELPAMKASNEPTELVIQAAGDAGPTVIRDVLVGEVWHCSGQSNMEWPVQRSNNAEQEIASADLPSIRLFTMKKQSVAEPQFKGEGRWDVCSPQTVGDFSGVGYFFGRRLHEELDVPIGLIDTSWGGAAAEAYTSVQSIADNATTQGILSRYEQRMAEWEAAQKDAVDPSTLPERHTDPGNDGEAAGLATPEFDDSGWTAVTLPGAWERGPLGNIDGVVWFRRRVALPQAMRGRELTLHLGAIDDFDTTYINGRQVGSTGYETATSWETPRVYSVPAELTAQDELVIAVRVFDHFGGGGFQGPAEQMMLTLKDDAQQSVALKGPWLALARHPLSPSALRAGHQRPVGPQHVPGALWNGMVYPLAPYAVRGATWYQGETNGGRGIEYRTLLPMLIEDWRALWDQPGDARDFPFLIVQLANFQQPADKPGADNGWSPLREAQHLTAQSDPNAYIATAIDIGEADDIHPTNKQELGRRLALIALRHVYGQDDIEDQGPVFIGMETADGRDTVVLRFEHAEGLTTTDGAAPRGFAVRGADGAWRWAKASVEGQTIVIDTVGLTPPITVRYGWAMNPAGGEHAINVVNAAGLPAFPFRTDMPE